METVLLVVGKTPRGPLGAAIDDYLARLKHYLPFRIEVLPDAKGVRSMSEAQQKDAEGRLFMDALKPGDCVVLLDERGREFTSVEFSAFLQQKMAAGLRRLLFVVGGPYGFSPQMYGRADAKISLSRMTMTHEMVRLLFVEQVYRAMTILRGEPYHHE